MDQLKITERIAELEREIASLPPGSVSVKKVKNKEYYYHRFTRNGNRSEIYIDFDKVDELRSQIDKRKTLESELKALKHSIPAPKKARKMKDSYEFKTYVRMDEQLVDWAEQAKGYKKRKCYDTLRDFVFGKRQDKVFILYGLRRTGKTTLIRQAVLDMPDSDLSKTAFIQISSKDTLSSINSDLKHLEMRGYKYVFIDEVTLMEDFIEGAALFSDIYASSGMKIVLSGTDSLGFIFTESEQLYDRCVLLHTTFIPYREFEDVLGIHGVDEFIRYGGTMSMSGVNYNQSSPFANEKRAKEYINSAIARNIQHSLKHYQDGGHFRLLSELYQKGELTSAINRVVEDVNHRFTKETLTKTFTSGDLSLAARNLLKDRTNPIDLNENIDYDLVVNSIKDLLDILEKEEQTVEAEDDHAYQIKEYLSLLDLIMEVDVLHFPNVNQVEKKVVISQPGLRFAQVNALVDSLLKDEKFAKLSIIERNRVLDRVIGTITGRMIEDLVLLETKIAAPHKQVFQLQFAVGEFDMVIHDPDTLTCEIYEIKLSREVVPAQYQHLINEEKCAGTEHRFGRITGKYVIYRGEPTESEGIRYLNVEDYLKHLS